MTNDDRAAARRLRGDVHQPLPKARKMTLLFRLLRLYTDGKDPDEC